MVEEDDGGGEDCLWILRSKRVLAELDDLFGWLTIHNKVQTSLSLVNISKHLQTDQMIVVDNLILWVLNIHALEVLEYSDVKGFPMLVKDMCCLTFMLEKESKEIDQCNF